MQTRLELDRNNQGHAYIGATDFDDEGRGVRSYVLSGNAHGDIADAVMVRRFHDMLRLMGDNVEAWVTPEYRDLVGILRP